MRAACLPACQAAGLSACRPACMPACMSGLLKASSKAQPCPAPGHKNSEFPSCTRSKGHLLLLLDGLAAGLRRCAAGSYELRSRVPCTAAASLLAGGQAEAPAGGASTAAVAPWASLPPAGAGTNAGATLYERTAAAGAAEHAQQAPPTLSWPTSHLATLRVPMLRQADLRASLPEGQEIATWRVMGDLSRASAGPGGDLKP